MRHEPPSLIRAACQDLRRPLGPCHHPGVSDIAPARLDRRDLPLRPQDEVECRRCDVLCDKVVYPGACIERACPFVYAYEAWGHTYIGCLQKVFDVEIDLDLLQMAEQRRDGFGAVRARRTPLPMCRWRSARATSTASTRSAAGIPNSSRPRRNAPASASWRSSATPPTARRLPEPDRRRRTGDHRAPSSSPPRQRSYTSARCCDPCAGTRTD